MKKKKLKKRIKKLEKKVEKYRSNLSDLITRVDISLTNKIRNLSDAYTNRFNKFNPEDIKTINDRIDSILMDTNYLRTSIQRINVRCDILDRRTQTDYSKVAQQIEETKNEEKTCDTCKWRPLMEQGGQDIPCMGCTADDKKMWKSEDAD